MSDLYYKIPVKISIGELGDREEELPAVFSYNDFRQKLLRMFSIPESAKLEFINDYGENQFIKDQGNYTEALLCTNGLAHYMKIKENIQIVEVQRIQSTSWTCTRCHTVNVMENTKCRVCTNLPSTNSY